MATSAEFNEEQLAAARKPLWHQAGDPLLTGEAAKEFVDRFGLVQFASGRLGMPGPSLVEATLGERTDAPSAAQSQVARELVGRLAGEGAALPLNLLGGGGDAPDFIVSVAAFRFVFTLRGDKSWKQPPSTSGAVKVSPLALRVFEVLSERGALTAADLASELGREVTEAAIVRALNELWQMLRVIPLHAAGDSAPLWELTTRRFTKAIKAGVNAGQPTALSALISLYLHQVLSATGEEIETFLSPLAARSRVREVLHALVAARELGETVVAGKTLLHVSGELPDFAPLAPEAAAEGAHSVARGEAGLPVYSETETPEPGRIRKFGGRPSAAPRTREGGNVAFRRAPREGSTERERRPFNRDAAAQSDPTRPWDDEAKPRRERPAASGDAAERPRRTFSDRKPAGDRRPGSGDRIPGFGARKFGDRASGNDRPRRAFGSAAGSGERKPYVRRDSAESGGERKPFAPRGPRKPFDAAGGGDRPRKPFGERKPFTSDRPRKPFDGERKPFTSDRPRRSFGADREGGSDRPRRSFSSDRSSGPGDRPQRAFGGERKSFARRDDGAPAGDASARKPFAPRGPRKPFDGERKPFTSDRPRRPFSGDREGGSSDRPRRPFGGDRASAGPRKPYVRREDGAPAGDRPARKSFGDRSSAGARKPFGAKSPAGPRKPFGAKPGGFKGKPGAGKPAAAKPFARKPRRGPEE